MEDTTFKIYLFLVKEAKPSGPRDVMRGTSLSSPSVAYRHLQKLENLGLIQKNSFGQYTVIERQTSKDTSGSAEASCPDYFSTLSFFSAYAWLG